MRGYIIKTTYFRIFVKGSFSLIEIDFGRLGRTELVIHLFTKQGLFEAHINEWPRTYLSH